MTCTHGDALDFRYLESASGGPQVARDESFSSTRAGQLTAPKKRKRPL
jgi:hypothetical protein